MKLATISLLTLGASTITACFVEKHETDQVILNEDASEQLYLVELGPGDTYMVTQEEKWDLRRKGFNFMDITDTPHLGKLRASQVGTQSGARFPSAPTRQKELEPLIEKLSKLPMQENLEGFTSFYDRYYLSDSGMHSSAWLLETVSKIISDSGADKYGAYVEPFKHIWGQNSVIAVIPGKSNRTIVIGAHQDSVNIFGPTSLASPGADDDGSGTVTTLEALRVLLTAEGLLQGNAENTVEFHWYSAEEGGLLGSRAIFNEYEKTGRDVRAMLQQDMTGFIQRTLDAGEEEHMGICTDHIDLDLTNYIKKIITTYCDIPYIEFTCGFACSDHASATRAGYPSAFVAESDRKYWNDRRVHTKDDKIEYLSFDHMLQHAKLALGLVYELAYFKFD